MYFREKHKATKNFNFSPTFLLNSHPYPLLSTPNF